MKTWATLKSEIRAETNTEGEEMFADSELLAWANDARAEASATIVDLYDKYLETEGNLTLVDGEDEVSLPSDIYANKFTGIYYNDGSTKYEILPLKRKSEILCVQDTDRYKYRIFNKTSGRVVKIYPKARESSSTNVSCFYIRQSQALALDTDTLDIPIADNFIKQYVKDRMLQKELGPMNFPWPSQALEREQNILVEALNNMVPDENNEIEGDMSFYEDFDNDGWR